MTKQEQLLYIEAQIKKFGTRGVDRKKDVIKTSITTDVQREINLDDGMSIIASFLPKDNIGYNILGQSSMNENDEHRYQRKGNHILYGYFLDFGDSIEITMIIKDNEDHISLSDVNDLENGYLGMRIDLMATQFLPDNILSFKLADREIADSWKNSGMNWEEFTHKKRGFIVGKKFGL